MYNEVLKHYGVIGQKWGVRKSRSSSLKATAKNSIKKYASAAQVKRESEKKRKTEIKTYNRLKKKKVSDLTDSELAILNKRYDAEEKLFNSKQATNSYKTGKKEVQKVLSDSVKQTVKPVLVKSGTYAVNRIIKNTKGVNEPMNWNNFADFVAPVKEKKKD